RGDGPTGKHKKALSRRVGGRGPSSCSHTGWHVVLCPLGSLLWFPARVPRADPQPFPDQGAHQVPAPVGPALLALVPARVPGTRAVVSPGRTLRLGPSDSTGSPPRAQRLYGIDHTHRNVLVLPWCADFY